MVMYRMLLLYFAACFTSLAVGSHLETSRPAYRTKRVVYGTDLLEPTEYSSTEYFVWIGNGNECDIPLPDALLAALGKHPNYEVHIPNLGFVCSPSKHHLWCTGSLLMPQVVQTACHCVADYIWNSNEGLGRPSKFNVNEKRFHIYPGRNLVSNMTNGVPAQRYIHHPLCTEQGSSYPYDFALIVLERSMDPFQRTYAPTYTVDRLANLWMDSMRKRKICLFIGFGGYMDRFGTNAEIKSPVLLHGWMRTLDYMSCYEKNVAETGRRLYRELATWFCVGKMPDHATYSTGHGDSGGPVSCDNEYIGVTSHLNVDRKTDVVMSTAFTPLENSATYRRQLVQYLKDNNDVMYTTSDPIGYKFLPTAPPIILKGVRLQSTSVAPRSEATFMLSVLLVVIVLSIKSVVNS